MEQAVAPNPETWRVCAHRMHPPSEVTPVEAEYVPGGHGRQADAADDAPVAGW